MKRLKGRILAAILLCGLLAACGKNDDDGKTQYQAVDEVDMDREDMPMTEAGAETGAEMGTEVSETAEKEKTEPVTEEAAASPRILSEAELKEFTDFVCQWDNYGFLLSVYDDPSDIYLNEVFYSYNMGKEVEPLSDQVKAAYLEAAGQEELYTDLTIVTTAEINEFLMKKTGMTYDQMNKPLDWVYVPEYDAYFQEAGDTNYCPQECISGSTVDEKTFTLRFRRQEYLEDSGYHQLDCEAVLQKSEEGYRFVSNRMIIEEGLIKEQMYPIMIEGVGEGTFAPYEPDTEIDPLADVTFYILTNGQTFTFLNGMDIENIRTNQMFNNIEAVSFPDYNQDGYQDIITICNYTYASGPDAGVDFSEVRIYSGNEYGYFVLNKEVTDAANSALAEKTVKSVLGFLGSPDM